MALPIIENIAEKSALAVKGLIIEQADQIRKDINYIVENAPENKKVVLRMSHSIAIDLDSSEQKDVLTWSLTRRVETSSALTATPSGGHVGEDDDDGDPEWGKSIADDPS